MNSNENKTNIGLLKKTEKETKKPSMYNVIMLNDDYTPMDFVVQVLKSFFYKQHEEAIKIMLKVHYKGQANCGTYTREVAETKIVQVAEFARKNAHPLKCVIRKES